MRLFVALPVDQEVRAALATDTAAVRQDYPQVAWTRSAGWHLTLAFLGEVDEGSVPAIVAACEAALVGSVAGARIELRLGTPGHFGRRVAFISVDDDPNGAVARCGARVQAALAAAGVAVDDKPVRPHITLARARRGRLPTGLVEALPTTSAGWAVDGAQLVRSHLGRGPARYEVLASLPL